MHCARQRGGRQRARQSGERNPQHNLQRWGTHFPTNMLARNAVVRAERFYKHQAALREKMPETGACETSAGHKANVE